MWDFETKICKIWWIFLFNHIWNQKAVLSNLVCSWYMKAVVHSINYLQSILITELIGFIRIFVRYNYIKSFEVQTMGIDQLKIKLLQNHLFDHKEFFSLHNLESNNYNDSCKVLDHNQNEKWSIKNKSWSNCLASIISVVIVGFKAFIHEYV